IFGFAVRSLLFHSVALYQAGLVQDVPVNDRKRPVNTGCTLTTLDNTAEALFSRILRPTTEHSSAHPWPGRHQSAEGFRCSDQAGGKGVKICALARNQNAQKAASKRSTKLRRCWGFRGLRPTRQHGAKRFLRSELGVAYLCRRICWKKCCPAKVR